MGSVVVQYTASMIHLPWAQPKYIAMSYAAEDSIYQGKGWLNTTSSFQNYISRTGGSLILPLSFSGLFSSCKGRRTASADGRTRLFGTCPLCRESPPQGSLYSWLVLYKRDAGANSLAIQV